MAIVIDMVKAKAIAHDKRRNLRSIEFSPYDDIIAKRIPGTSEIEAEAQRQLIRAKYATVQEEIDAANTVDQLKLILNNATPSNINIINTETMFDS